MLEEPPAQAQTEKLSSFYFFTHCTISEDCSVETMPTDVRHAGYIVLDADSSGSPQMLLN